MGRYKLPPADRFWLNVNKHGPEMRAGLGACWVWGRGPAKNGKYGRFHVGNRSRPAHVFSYELAYGPLPDGLICRHKCDNPPCVRPDHLESGTHKDNARDRTERGRVPPSFGEFHARTNLTDAEVLAMREAARSGETHASIAARHGMDRRHVSMLIEGRIWGHIPGLSAEERKAHRDKHRMGERNGRAELSEESVRAILVDRAADMSFVALAEKYGVGETTIGHILAGRSWASITAGHAELVPPGPRRGSRHHTKQPGYTVPKGESSALAVLDDQKVRDIRARAAAGEKQTLLAVTFGVSHALVSLIVNRKRWAHVA